MQRDLLFLSEAIQAAEKIVRLSEGATADSLQADERTLDAVLWNFTVLGEACSQFTQKEQFPSISWHQPIAMRNRVVHGYWSADLQVLLDTVQEDLPKLITQLGHALAELS